MSKLARLRTIVVATDFSANAADAMLRAAEIARKHSAHLVLAHASIFVTPPGPELSRPSQRMLGETRSQAQERLDLALRRLRREGGSRALKLLEVEGTLTPLAGLGIDAIALRDYNATKAALARSPFTRPLSAGAVAYLVAVVGRTMPTYLLRPHPRVRIVNEGETVFRLGPEGRPVAEIEPGQVIYDGPSRMVAMSTIPYWGFGARIFPFADPHGDSFNLRCVNIGSVAVAGNLRSIWKGSYRSAKVTDFSVRSVTIELDRPRPLEIAGDSVGMRERVNVALHPEPIRVVDYFAPPPIA